ncbi:MAG: biopolymer transporter ExbD [Flavobacteriales bacterium]|nr:biopolymer transporter ExbD [Flavobacteriales bacterium]
MALGSRNKISVNFSMASMTDIVFLLLIFFMITSTFVSPNALKVNLPSSTGKVKKEKTTVSVNILDDYSYAVNMKPVELDFLESAIMNELNGVDNPGLILHADKTVPIEYVVNVMDIANKNRLALVLATRPSK